MKFIHHKVKRFYLPEDFTPTSWDVVAPWYNQLIHHELDSPAALTSFLTKWSELEAALSENLAWRYIKMTCNTQDATLQQAYEFFITEIYPRTLEQNQILNQKLLQAHDLEDLEKQTGFNILIRNVSTQVKLFRQENIPLMAEAKKLESEYGTIAGALTIQHEGETLTLQQAAALLKTQDRTLRKNIWIAIQEARNAVAEQLDELLSKLIALRHQIAVNAGFNNFRDYQFMALGRYDYTPQQCFDFHEAIANEIMPLRVAAMELRLKQTGYQKLYPFDTKHEPTGKAPLKPFANAEMLIDKGIAAFSNMFDYFGKCIDKMKELQHFDLDSRVGKAPGGYNYPLAETGAPFIFMNSTGTMEDLETFFHEGGHAIHAFLTHTLLLDAFKNPPMEVAEVASMTMELFAMSQYPLFFDTPELVQRAKNEQLERSIAVLPWIAAVDAFQHWLYENPTHTIQERKQKWMAIFQKYTPSSIDWSEYQTYIHLQWQAQLHIFEVPFYYIEYGIAQLGAIGIWKKYTEDPRTGIENYLKMLSAGNMYTLPDTYEKGGLPFDFSEQYIQKLAQFVQTQIQD